MSSTERDTGTGPTPGIVAGIWKFNMDKVSSEELLELALEWRSRAHGVRYEGLSVRQCSDKQWGIGFQVALCSKTSPQFFHAMTDQLKRKFGNDFVGWDYSDKVWTVPTA
ncbi:MAG: hypothetical protein JWL87_706 [Candidatus Adlerbacteria bacterium]|nr:hypothetical protein [Candidatus Adlerbacteria bacterium]